MPDKHDEPLNQHARFIETARALGCDENEAAFDEKLKLIARQKPKEASKDGGQKSDK